MKADFPAACRSQVSLGRTADFQLGGLLVKPARREVAFGSETRSLEPRVMQVLVALAGESPAVVSRDRLAEACWGGVIVGDDAINRCIVALRQLAREFDPQPFSIETIPRVGYSLIEGPNATKPPTPGGWRIGRRWLYAIVPAIAAVLIAGYFLWQMAKPDDRQLSVAVTAATPEPLSDSVARDLVAKLGMLNSANGATLRLFEYADARHPDLLFEVEASQQDEQIETNLVLRSNADREVLWSKGFRQPRTNLPDLKQQLAYAAAKVLECALEARSDGGARLDRATRKLYLNGCAAYADASEERMDDLHAIFSEVVRDAPDFQPGLRRLLMVETEIVGDPSLTAQEAASDRARLQQTMTAARKLGADMPELLLGQAALFPASAFAGRMRLVDQAVREDPKSAETLVLTSGYAMRSGQMEYAVAQARLAARLDPLSPSVRQTLIATLVDAGRTSEAEEELRTAERFWPGAETLNSVRFQMQLRSGDSKEALRRFAAETPAISRKRFYMSFLVARADPSPANVDKALDEARAVFSRDPTTIYHLAQTLVAFGREEELFAILLQARDVDEFASVRDVLFRPAFHDFHRDPRMIRVASRLGLLDYWQASGRWPDFCFQPDLPYDCKREAAALGTK